jgi:hypothetical protein
MGDIELMLGKRPSNIWKYSWKFIAPTALLVKHCYILNINNNVYKSLYGGIRSHLNINNNKISIRIVESVSDCCLTSIFQLYHKRE